VRRGENGWLAGRGASTVLDWPVRVARGRPGGNDKANPAKRPGGGPPEPVGGAGEVAAALRVWLGARQWGMGCTEPERRSSEEVPKAGQPGSQPTPGMGTRRPTGGATRRHVRSSRVAGRLAFCRRTELPTLQHIGETTRDHQLADGHQCKCVVPSGSNLVTC